MPSFIDKVRNKEIPQPTQRNFTLHKWEQKFNQTIEPSDEDIKLYKSGVWVFQKLESIRRLLLPLHFDDVSREIHIKLLIAYVNRVPHLLSHIALPYKENQIRFAEQPLQAHLGSINPVNPKSDPDMILMSSVDGLRYPLKLALSSKKDSSNTYDDKEILMKIFVANTLAQYYDHISIYWMKCLWNGWYIDSNEDIDLVIPPKTDFPAIEAVSDYRRQVLNSELIIHFETIWSRFDEQVKKANFSSTPNVITKGSGKKVKYDVRPHETDNLRSGIMLTNRVIADRGYYTPFFNEQLPELPGVTIDDLLRFWEVLHSIGMAQIDKLSAPAKQRDINTINDVLIYAPTLYFDQTKALFKKWLNFSNNKIEQIIKFFTYTSDSNAELWCKPIIKIDERKFVLLWSPVVYGNMERTVELWMKESNFDFGRNGFLFESYAREDIATSISKSSDLIDAEVINKSIKFKKGKGEEEIDLIIRIGNTILVGEIKAILFPAEPLERANYFKVLDAATEQAQRKLNFIKENIDSFEEFITLTGLINKEELKFSPFVLINQPFGAGFTINNVPIVDLLILNRYFENEWQQLVLVKNNIQNPLKVMNFYSSKVEAEQIVFNYLQNPPQLERYKQGLKPEFYVIPPVNKNEKDIHYGFYKVTLPIPEIDYEVSPIRWR